MSIPLEVSAIAARRFVLGKQGLWPGRRWEGKDGARAAMRAVEHLQLDPLVILARSHDLMLHSRVREYEPRHFDELVHRDREFFDWGGWLAVRPMDELPYWRVIMRRNTMHRGTSAILAEHEQAVIEMRAALAAGARLSSRDLEATGTETGKTYRGSKARSLALYFLWRTGEAMTFERRGFERVYAATEAVAPSEFLREVEEHEAELFLLRKEISHNGLGKVPLPSSLTWGYGRKFTAADRLAIERELVERGDLTPVKVEGWKGQHLVVTADLPLLEAVAAGGVPEPWRAAEDEASFLSPLDPVTARGRSKELFDVDYVWEIYKRPAEVKYGRFTMPILWRDQFVGRVDAKLDRARNTVVVNGLWLEDGAIPRADEFLPAIAAEFERTRQFLGAKDLDFSSAGGSAAAIEAVAG